MIVSHRFTKTIVVDLNYTEPFCIFYSYLRSDDSNDGKKEITRKYKCPTCDKSYTQSHNLKKHRQREHGL